MKAATTSAQSTGASRTAGAERTMPPRRRTSSASSPDMRASSTATRTPSRPLGFRCNTDEHVLFWISCAALVCDVRNHLLENRRQIAARHIVQNLRARLEYVDGFDDLIADFHVLAKQPDVAPRMVTA